MIRVSGRLRINEIDWRPSAAHSSFALKTQASCKHLPLKLCKFGCDRSGQ
jgi:hypothetical protein